MAKGCLSVTPCEALADEKLFVQGKGLPPLQRVTIQATMKERHHAFASYGHFMADEKGEVDVSKQSSTGGTYTGIHSMGLIWSMISGPGVDRRSRYTKRDITTPAIVKFTLWAGHLSLDDLYKEDASPLAKCEVKRWYKAKKVRREEIKTGLVRGTLFTPPGSGPFPGVIDIFGVIGGLLEFRAALLASRGFAVFAMPLFGYDDMSKSPASTSLEYLNETVEWLIGHPLVISDGIGVVGVSRGGSVGQLMALYCPKVRAIVKINGPPFIFHHPIQSKTIKIPPAATFDISKLLPTPEGRILKDLYAPKTSDYIQAWRRDVPTLDIIGEDDLCLNPSYNINYYHMIPEEKRKNFTMVRYKGAGHLIEPPYAPHCRISYEKNLDGYTIWGGNAQDQNYAQEDSWMKIRSFLSHHLRKKCELKNKL